MNAQRLMDTAKALVADDKGLLAMDESNPTCNQRFAKLGIPQTEEMRRAYRELIVTTRGLSESISGAILYDETIRQRVKDGTPFASFLADAGIIPGIKVDTGAKNLAGHPGEKITEGLDGLRDRLAEYSQMGARFAKWRSVIAIGEGIPTRGSIEANAHSLARYAALCQEAGLVPVVEPEVLMDGEHTLERCGEVTEELQRTVFDQLYRQGVMPEGVILKPNMVLPGSTCPKQETVEDVADATVRCLLRSVPAAVPGIAFLSGGQSAELASARLNAMNVPFESRLTYTAFSSQGPRIAFALSADLFHWQRLGLATYGRYHGVEIGDVDDKDASIFPVAIPNPSGHPELAMLHRPLFPGTRPEETVRHAAMRDVDLERESIWISYCRMALDGPAPVSRLGPFACHHRLATPVSPWERLKIGGGTPPVLTRLGWLIVYHGVREVLDPGLDGPHLCYSAGVMVLSDEHPRLIRYRSAEPVLAPVMPQERRGIVANVVFPTGIDRRDDLGSPDRFDVYHGMADNRIGVARLDLPDSLPPQGGADPPEGKV